MEGDPDMKSNLFIDIGCQSLNKHGEDLCGDDYLYERREDNTAVLVLSDGLGSGRSANKISTIVTRTALDMIRKTSSVEECVEAVFKALPVCDVHNIAYSTFTIVDVKNDLYAQIVQYDNPDVILLRDGKHVEFPKETVEVSGRTVYISNIKIEKNDIFIAMSDGAVHAGIGKSLNFGWKREDIIRFMESLYKEEYTAKMITTILLDQCRLLYEYEPGDDTTVCTIKIRQRKQVNLLVGPPANVEDDDKLLSLFFAKEGKHIVSGGSTSTIVARYLGKELTTDINTYYDPAIPPIGNIEGVSLVTEGIITMTRVLKYAEDYLRDNALYMQWSRNKDGASQLAKTLFEEATDVNLFVGRAVNIAHQSPDNPINFEKKMKMVEDLSDALRMMGKKINVMYF